METDIDTTNVCLVTMQAGALLMFNSPKPGEPFSKEKALVMAAWLVVMAGENAEGFSKYIAAVERS